MSLPHVVLLTNQVKLPWVIIVKFSSDVVNLVSFLVAENFNYLGRFVPIM